MKSVKFTIILLVVTLNTYAQSPKKIGNYLGGSIIADSSSTIMIPVFYNTDMTSSTKVGLWHTYYANIIFYDFNTDTHKKLFEKNTYIEPFPTSNVVSLIRISDEKVSTPQTTKDWIFYLVKNNDLNNDRWIDGQDPTILYASDKKGNKLKALTPGNENALTLTILENQGFILIKMQRDSNNNNKFENKDKDIYYLRVDLETLEPVSKIEIQ